jgi:hypothetical protein
MVQRYCGQAASTHAVCLNNTAMQLLVCLGITFSHFHISCLGITAWQGVQCHSISFGMQHHKPTAYQPQQLLLLLLQHLY